MSFNIMETKNRYLSRSFDLSSPLIDKYIAFLSNVNAEKVRRTLRYSNNSNYEKACKALVDLVYNSELIDILEEDELEEIETITSLIERITQIPLPRPHSC